MTGTCHHFKVTALGLLQWSYLGQTLWTLFSLEPLSVKEIVQIKKTADREFSRLSRVTRDKGVEADISEIDI